MMFSKKDLDELFIRCFPGIKELAEKKNKSALEWACEKIEMCIQLEMEMESLRKEFLKEFPETPDVSLTPIDEVLSGRFQKILLDAGFKTIGDLANSSPEKLLAIKKIGRRAIFDIETIFKSFGLWWK